MASILLLVTKLINKYIYIIGNGKYKKYKQIQSINKWCTI